MNDYLEKLNPVIRDYFKILSNDFPEFLIPYINTPRMQKQKEISVTCGTYYAKMFHQNLWYSSLDHSIATALIIWHFTKDKKETLAGLFHDIATPCFKHTIDYMNGDYEYQEWAEELTKTFILESDEIMNLLKKDGISVDEVCDYHMYPIADNDTPMLSSDRLEYTLSNGLGVVKKVWDLDEVKEIYSNITVFKKPDSEEEMGFTKKVYAEQFVRKMSILSKCYMSDERRFAMQFLADIMKKMNELGLISINDLYNLSEKEVIEKIKACHYNNISFAFNLWQNANAILVSDKEIVNKYCVYVKTKKRYIDPLVQIGNDLLRVSEISNKSNDAINECLNYDFNRYLYMDFELNDNVKTLSKK